MIWSSIRRLEPYLPTILHGQIRRITGRIGPNKQQLKQIELLGENLGLDRREVHAALDPPLGRSGIGINNRLTLFLTIVTVFIIVIIGVLVTWFIVDPDSFPIPTYVPGSLYGTIAPRDFSIYRTTTL